MKWLFRTNDAWPGLVLRLALGIAMFPHGMQKLFGWFGGGGFFATMASFTEGGMPSLIVFLIIIGESFGSVGLIMGFLSRFAAFGITIIMVGAVALVHGRNGFFMNWHGTQAGEGFEYHILAIGIGVAVMILGSGKWSVDGIIQKKLES